MVTRTGVCTLYYVSSNVFRLQPLLQDAAGTVRLHTDEARALITWRSEDQIQVCLVSWLDYCFCQLKTLLGIQFQFFQIFEALCISLYKTLSLQKDTLQKVGFYLDRNCQGYSFRPPERPTHKTGCLVCKNFAWKLLEQSKIVLHWTLKCSCQKSESSAKAQKNERIWAI